MNNNRNNNNRRRGRGNRPQGQGGGSPVNRIDSRARGNAPQMLEKYRKLAQDAQHNGDRVQAEYYLQFADHYYRVMADTRQRQEEQRPRRDDNREQRPQSADDYGRDDDGDLRDEGQDDRFAPRAGDRDDARRDDRRDPRERFDERDREFGRDTDARNTNEAPAQDAVEAGTTEAPGEQEQAPRRGRPPRNAAPRRDGQRPPRDANGHGERQSRTNANGAEPVAAIDASVLPPAFNVAETGDAEPAAPPVRRRRVKPVVQDGDAAAIAHG